MSVEWKYVIIIYVMLDAIETSICLVDIMSGKHVREMYTPLYPTFV